MKNLVWEDFLSSLFQTWILEELRHWHQIAETWGGQFWRFLVNLGGQNPQQIDQSRFLRPKGEPKATKLHPGPLSWRQTMPKVSQKSPKVIPRRQKSSKKLPKWHQKCPKTNKNPAKSGTRIQNDFGEHIWSENQQILAMSASPNLQKPL